MLLPLLLLYTTVGHRGLDGEACSWFIEHDPSVFVFIQKRYIFYVPLDRTVSHLRPRFASSVIRGIRGAKADVNPPWRSPSCIKTKKDLHYRFCIEYLVFSDYNKYW